MARRGVGAGAAAMLPAALAGAVLVSAPFAGTRTSPLADHKAAMTSQHHASASPASHGTPIGEWLVLGAAEVAFLGLGAGVAVFTRRLNDDR